MINQLRFHRFKRVTQTVLYAPHFISIMVVCGMIRIFLSPSGGLINLIAGTSIDFLTESSAFRTIFIASGIWQYPLCFPHRTSFKIPKCNLYAIHGYVLIDNRK